MLGEESQHSTKKLMVITVIVVVIILAVVIFAFRMLQKKHENMLSSVKDTEQKDFIIKVDEDEATTEEITLNVSEDETLTIVSSSDLQAMDLSEDMVYLIKGEDKGSNKYERVDRLSYTDTIYYTVSDLEYLDSYGLRITRNEIYARHGRMFNDQDIQEYFNRQPWYVAQTASSDFDESCLNNVEKYNADLIRSYELKRGY